MVTSILNFTLIILHTYKHSEQENFNVEKSFFYLYSHLAQGWFREFDYLSET